MFFAMLGAQFRSFARDRTTLFFAFAFPLMMATLFGLGLKIDVKPLKIAVYQASHDATSEGFIEGLSKGEGHLLDLVKVGSEAEARSQFDGGAIDGALIIPNLGNGGHLTLLIDEKAPESQQRTTATLGHFVQTYNLRLAGAREILGLDVRGLREGKGLAAFDFLVPIIIMFGVVFSALSGAAGRFSNYQQQGVFKRLTVTPLHPQLFLLTDLTVRVVVSVLQTALVIAYASLRHGFNITTPTLWLFVLAALGTVTFVALGVLLVSVAKSPEAAGALASLISLLMLFLSGAIPGHLFPPALIAAAKSLPLSQISESMRGVVLDGSNPFAATSSTLGIGLWLIVSIVLALATFRFKPPRPKKN